HRKHNTSESHLPANDVSSIRSLPLAVLHFASTASKSHDFPKAQKLRRANCTYRSGTVQTETTSARTACSGASVEVGISAVISSTMERVAFGIARPIVAARIAE